MTFGNTILTGIQQFSPFRHDVPPADLASRLSTAAAKDDGVAGKQTIPSRIPDRRNHTHHPDLRGTTGGARSCPAMLGIDKQPQAGESYGLGLGQVFNQLSTMFWKTLGWSTPAAPATQAGFKPLEFAPADKWPGAADSATAREKAALKGMVGLIEQHAKGIYNDFLQDYHQAGKGITEVEQLVGRNLTVYLNKADDNLFGQTKALLSNLTHEETLLIYAALVEVDKKTSTVDSALVSAQAAGFDLTLAHEKIQPIVDYYLAKKLDPEAHKIKGEQYRSHPGFMKVQGLRPNTKKLPVEVTDQLAYHAAFALILFAVRGNVFPENHKPISQGFAKEAQTARENVWRVATSATPGAVRDIPRYMPELPDDAFSGTELPEDTRIVPAMVEIPVNGNNVGTDAAVAIHPQNNHCLIEFKDHTSAQEPIRYAVSRDKPPMGEANPEVEVFDNLQDALNHWNKAGKDGAAKQDIFKQANAVSVSNDQALSALTSVIKENPLPGVDQRRYSYRIPLEGLDEKALWDAIKLKARAP